jgi:DNA repair exonuclease SbcCD nuclease subunit
MMRTRALRIACACAAAALLTSCAGVQYRFSTDTSLADLLGQPAPAYPAARFAVFSDAHLYDAGLGTDGAAFQEYMDRDRKLLPESREILAGALQRVEDLGVDFLLVTGDLTKDGEKQNHLLMAQQLAALSRKGIKVYVVPGNHDIWNPDAMSFSATSMTRVPNISPAEFAAIYRESGYGDALFRDPASLSYVAEPAPGLWLLAVDSASYGTNKGKGTPVTGGGFTQERVMWIETMLAEALRKGKAVIVMMHHGVVEHFPGQAKYYGDYLVNGWPEVSDMFAAWGARFVFTGHYHAQDVTLKRTGARKFLYDIETGSLVSYPNPVRLVTIDQAKQRLAISSLFIKELPSFAARGTNFWDFSRDSLHAGIAGIAIATMKKLWVSPEEAATIAPQIADAFAANSRGDENFTGTEMLKSKGLSFMAGIVVGSRKDLVTGLWHDREPADNDLSIDCAAGTWAVED